MDTNTIILATIFGAIGFAYMVYGKKQERYVSFFCGLGLCVFPYFIRNSFAALVVGLILLGLPFQIRE